MLLRKTKTDFVKITDFPAYFEFGPNVIKVVDDNNVIGVCWLTNNEDVYRNTYITENDWQPVEPAFFYEKFAEVSAMLIGLSGIEYNELQEGAYAD